MTRIHLPARQGTLRRAVIQDEHLLAGWLANPAECKWATGQHSFTRETYLQWLSSTDQIAWMFEIDDEPIGYGEVWVDEEARDVELAHLVIAPAFRGQGLGRLLTSKLYEQACGFQFPAVYLRVNPENQRAITAYEAVQFTRLDPLPSGFPAEWTWLVRPCEGREEPGHALG